ncbi:DNA-3-methyladenine glycosylase [Dactylosporangium sp. CA-233914]|uniref:DNA-3-methyladenine glycosylase n=1 Tax=Dactylosporangium sp. CA-233914 TaxID=3239934 RepID=UPI003D89E70F
MRLTEVEAYSGTGEDPASHAHRGRTPPQRAAGYAYVYFTYACTTPRICRMVP